MLRPTLLVFLLVACRAPVSDSPRLLTPADPSPWSDAAGNLADPQLAVLARDLWEEILRADPIEASRHGDARYHALLPDLSEAARAARRDRLAALAGRAQALGGLPLDDAERLTLALARGEIGKARAWLDLALERWLVEPGGGVHNILFNLAPDQPGATPAEREALRRRWAAMPRFVDQAREQLESGLREGLVASYTAIATSLEQLDRLLAQSVEEWPLGRPQIEGLAAAERERFLQEIRAGLQHDLRPALARLANTLRDELLPAARDDDHPGLVWLPDGRTTYDRLVAIHTGLGLRPEEIHDLGRAEVARIRSEMAVLGERLFGITDLVALQDRLRGDPTLHFATRNEVEETARTSLEQARARLATWFGRLPRAECLVVPIAPHEERDTTIAYYRPPAADGSRPGRYFINTYEPHTRPRFDARALAYHEAIPGHHLQIAIAQELEGVPRFQREAGSTAFVEGWALYAERLADEMGLYASDLDRIGMFSFEAWRACRLVVDTGLHAAGWTRQQAIDYLTENTLLAANNVANEVDRYIANPGQALAYKLGQLEILSLRRRAEERLGQLFDVRAFHDVVLSAGPVPLPVLQQRIDDWLEARATGASGVPAPGTRVGAPRLPGA